MSPSWMNLKMGQMVMMMTKKILSEWHNKFSVILHEVELLPAGWWLGPSCGKWQAF